MPKLTADLELCQGYGNCVVAAGDVYDLDDEGKVVLLTDTIAEQDRARVAEAARGCPVSALGVTG